MSFIYKELLGCIGVLASESKNRDVILNNKGIQLVVYCGKLNINKPKIVKTALGCLTNLSTSNESKAILATEPAFY